MFPNGNIIQTFAKKETKTGKVERQGDEASVSNETIVEWSVCVDACLSISDDKQSGKVKS